MDALPLQITPLIRLATVMLTVAMLALGRDFFIPLALAALFAFLLKPVVSVLNHRLKFPRTLAVIAVTVLVFSSLGGLVWVLGSELHHLAQELPRYRQNIQQRVLSLREAGRGGIMEKLQNLAKEVTAAPTATPTATPQAAPDAPVMVEMSANRIQEGLIAMLGHIADSLGTAAVVALFVIFILLRQQDLRNRVIHLVGYSRLTTTTRALDEAATKVSRYLLMQSIINGVYGVLLALGFWAIGLPYVVLWGVLAALFRFVPYIGPWIAAILPAALSLAVFDGWTQPLLVFTLITGLELLTNMVLEPLIYGQSAGVSDLALIIAIAFWTWLWGPLGLLLATPLTVCLVVFSKHVPELRFIEILMGDRSEVQPALIVYQRLLVGDVDEAESLARAAARAHGQEHTIDQTLLPAAVHARREMLAGRLTSEETNGILDSLSTLANEVSLEESPTPTTEITADAPLILCRSFDAPADSIALTWLTRTLAPGSLRWESIPKSALASEVIAQVEAMQPQIICLSAMPPGSSSTAHVLCRRLRHRFPELKIMLARWGSSPLESPKETGASWVVTTTGEARERITTALHIEPAAV